MKKSIILSIVLSAGYLITFAQTKETKAEIINDLNKKLTEQFVQAGVKADNVKNFVDCYCKEVESKLNQEESASLLAVTSARMAGTSPSAQTMEIFSKFNQEFAKSTKNCYDLLNK